MKNKKWLVLIGIVLVGIVALFIFNGTKDDTKENTPKEKPKPIAYEILDESVELDKEVDKWLKNNLNKAGFYTKKTEKETFVLMSGGTQKTTGYGISLNAVNQEKKNIHVEYEVIAPPKSVKMKIKKTNPHMVLRIASSEVKVDGKIVPLEDTKQESKTK